MSSEAAETYLSDLQRGLKLYQNPPEIKEINVQDSNLWKTPDYINTLYFCREFYGLDLSSPTKTFAQRNKVTIILGNFDVTYQAHNIFDIWYINGITAENMAAASLSIDYSFVWFKEILPGTYVLTCKDVGSIFDVPRLFVMEQGVLKKKDYLEPIPENPYEF